MIKVGIIGYGLSGRIFHGAIIGALEGFEVRKIMTKDPEKVALAKAAFQTVQIVDQPEAIFEDAEIDLVVISTPNTSHFSLATSALLAGKHVVVEKPFTVTSEEAQQLVDLSQLSGKRLSIYHNRRFDSDFLTLKKVLAEGRLGRIVAFESRFERYRSALKPESWREQDLPGSGILYDLGSHLIDQALTLFGMPQEIYADVRSERLGLVDDAFEIILYYQDLKVTLLASMLVKEPMPRFILRGENGSFVKFGMDVQEENLRNSLRPIDESWGTEPESQWGILNGQDEVQIIESMHGDYRLYYQNIHSAITEGAALEVTAEQGLQVIRLIELARQSHQEKRRIII